MKIGLILLAILKGIGIVLLALLLLVLLLVLVVLLSPIRYRLQGEKQAALSGSFAVSYLWGAIRAEGSYTPEGQNLRVNVLWFTLIGGEEKPKKAKKKKKSKKAAQPKAEPVAKQPKPAPQPDLQAAEKTEPKKPAQPKAEPAAKQPKPTPQWMAEKQPKTVRRVQLSAIEEKPPMEDAALSPEDAAFFTGEEEPAEQAEKKGKLPPIVQEIWHLEQKKEIGKALMKLLKRLMKGILSGNLFLKATLGTGEPAATGYLLGLAGILTAKFGNDIQIKADFTKATAEDIEVRVKGKIVLGKLLFAVLAFVLTKPVRKAIRKMITFLRRKDAA